MTTLKDRLKLLKETISNQYDKEMLRVAKLLNSNNIKKFGRVDNYGAKWISFSGEITKEVLHKAYLDGCSFSNVKPSKVRFNKWFSSIGNKLLNGKKVTIYRGIHLNTLFDKDYLTYLNYNLMDRNSWTISLSKAKEYADDETNKSDVSLVLKMKCDLGDVNLCFSAWLEGAWSDIGNKEVNLKKSLKVQDITICYIDRRSENNLKRVGFSVKEFNR